jgi:hypothetical protein
MGLYLAKLKEHLTESHFRDRPRVNRRDSILRILKFFESLQEISVSMQVKLKSGKTRKKMTEFLKDHPIVAQFLVSVLMGIAPIRVIEKCGISLTLYIMFYTFLYTVFF